MIYELNIILSKLLPSEYRSYYKAWKGKINEDELIKIKNSIYNKYLKKLENETYKNKVVDYILNELSHIQYQQSYSTLPETDRKTLTNDFDEEFKNSDGTYNVERLANYYAELYLETNFKYFTDELTKNNKQVDLTNLYKDLFNGKFRVVLPFEMKDDVILRTFKSKNYDDIKIAFEFLLKMYFTYFNTSYTIKDWLYGPGEFISGYIVNKKDEKKKISIGKILSEVLKNNKNVKEVTEHSEALKKLNTTYNQRPAKKNNLVIVISRHPYDIAGMSTDRGWRSCMNIDLGVYKEFVLTSIIKGTLIAYVVDKKDTNINKPLNRILIKPYRNKKDQDINLEEPNFILKTSQIYGAELPGFQETVQEWLDKNWNDKVESGDYMLDSEYFYHDEEDKFNYKHKK